MKNGPKLEVVDVALLKVDYSYQKQEYPRLVDKIVKKFDPNILGELTVNKREDGFYYVIDGQHRCAAIKRLGFKIARCIVYDGLTVEEEAYLYAGLAIRKQQTPNEIIKADLMLGKPYAIEIQDVVKKNGLEICFDRSGRGIKCGAALRDIHKKYGVKIFDESLKIINSVFPGKEDALVKHYILGISMFLSEYGDMVDKKRITNKLSMLGFEAFNAKANYFAMTYGREKGVKEAVLHYYNYHAKEKLA